jgi:hypothetical protein
MKFFWQRTMLFCGTAVVLAACSMGTQVTTTQEVSESVDAPYKKILVIALFDGFDPRAYLEKEVVLKLAEFGTDAVASTTMMNSRTPVTRATFIAMVDEINADAVLVTQLSNLETKATVKDMRPEATVNFRPTYYYNVFSVETTEYVEPQSVEFEYDLVLTTELFSVREREGVWAIQASSRFVMDHDQTSDYSIYVDEAKAIATQMRKDGLIVR